MPKFVIECPIVGVTPKLKLEEDRLRLRVHHRCPNGQAFQPGVPSLSQLLSRAFGGIFIIA